MDEHKMGADEDLRTIQFPWRLYPAWFWTRVHGDRLPLFPHASHAQPHGFSSTLWIGLVPPTAAKGWWNVLRSARIILLNHHHTYIAARHMRRLLIMLQIKRGAERSKVCSEHQHATATEEWLLQFAFMGLQSTPRVIRFLLCHINTCIIQSSCFVFFLLYTSIVSVRCKG